jgi:hypothetical protein
MRLGCIKVTTFQGLNIGRRLSLLEVVRKKNWDGFLAMIKRVGKLAINGIVE